MSKELRRGIVFWFYLSKNNQYTVITCMSTFNFTSSKMTHFTDSSIHEHSLLTLCQFRISLTYYISYSLFLILCFMNEQATVMNENTSFNFIRSTNLWFYDGFYTRELNRSMSTVERYFHIITSKIRTKFKISMLRKIANVLNISMVLGYPLSLPEMYKFLLNFNYLSMWCSFKFSAFYLYQTLHLFIGLL